MKKIILLTPIIFVFAFLPIFAGAADTSSSYQFKRDGIFGCSQNGSYAMSVGALGATGGVYVPVADATVELNTGTLVYQQCVLREVIDREREAATSAYFAKATQAIQTGRNGGPQYVVNEGQEIVTQVTDPTMLKILQGNTLQALNSTLQGPVTRALAQNYQAKTRTPQSALTCPYQGDLNAALNGSPSGSIWDAITALENPACTYLGSYYLAQDLANTQIANAVSDQLNQWNWGNGYYSQTDSNGNIVTPGINVEQSYQQQLNSPLTQLESANDIGQMIGALYAGVTTQVLSTSQGLAGLSQSTGGQPSYLSQLQTESSQGVQNAAANAALTILNASLQVETAYLQAVQSIASSLTTTIGQLQSAENQCWANLIPAVCATSLSSSNTCTSVPPGPCTTNPTTHQQTCPTGVTLQVATSTAFSQAAVNGGNIPSLGSAAKSGISTSQNALTLINKLIAGVTNTASLDAQSLALEQLDQLVAQHSLHTQTDLSTVTNQASTIQSTMTTLVQTTVQNWSGVGSDSSNPQNLAWDGTVSPGNGWCNINNPTTIAEWIAKWKKQ